jgi:glycosyltransferase involved in cell wall biosynthesis
LSSPELVSVVIPTLNRPQLLWKAVMSALAQTYSPIEVIVVIDGEDRPSEETLASINDARLRVIPLAVNMGGSEARNIGVRAAEGTWIAFLDDDDEWLPKKIDLQMEAANASRSAFPIISTRLIVRTPERDLIRPIHAVDSKLPISEQLFWRKTFADGSYTMQTSTLFTRREAMLTIPFRSGLKRHQDWDWLLRAARNPKVSFYVLSEPLTVFRANDDRQSVGRALDWNFSLRWAQEMRGYFTPKAYSFFVATECVSRAVKRNAGLSANSLLIREFAFRGCPTARSLMWLLAFLFIPQRCRRYAQKLLRNFISKGQASSRTKQSQALTGESTLLRTN